MKPRAPILAALVVSLAAGLGLTGATAGAAGGCGGMKVTIRGTDGNDTIVGQDGVDVIEAGEGSDRIRGKGAHRRRPRLRHAAGRIR